MASCDAGLTARPRVAYVTSAEAHHDDEIEPVVLELLARDVVVEPVRWDAPSVDWAAYDLAVVRSVWDYVNRRAEFLSWARAVDRRTRLLNPASVLEHNTDKRYLRDLGRRGVPAVPTLWSDLDGGLAEDEVATAMCAWSAVVAKPAVSASARDTVHTGDLREAVQHVGRIVGSGRVAMLQPYLGAVEGEGETSVIVLGGALSHAVRRAPALLANDGHDATPRPLTHEFLEITEQTLAAVPERADLLYARVDVVRAPDGRLRLLELELTEPSLFLRLDRDAPGRFADAVVAALARSRLPG